MVGIHVGEHGAEPFDRCRLCSSRHKEKVFRDVAIQGGEEPLGTERAKEHGKDRVDISKSDRSVCWVDKVCAYLKPCSWSEEYDPARRVAVEEIRRQQVRCGTIVWNPVPLISRRPVANVPPTPLLFPKKALKASTLFWISAGVAPDASNTCGAAEAATGLKMSVKPKVAIASERQCLLINEFLIESVVFIILFSGCDAFWCVGLFCST